MDVMSEWNELIVKENILCVLFVGMQMHNETRRGAAGVRLVRTGTAADEHCTSMVQWWC